jgi:hypothetical protein
MTVAIVRYINVAPALCIIGTPSRPLNTDRPRYITDLVITKPSLLCDFSMKNAASSVILALLLSALGAAAPIEGNLVSDCSAFSRSIVTNCEH